jgi:hypothetical protein
MACNHKFKSDLNISYAKDWLPETLIVGTFNPEWTDNNSAQWFYGRVENNFFWSVLPQIYGEKSMLCKDVKDWKRFCQNNKIALTDLIECITTANYDEHKNIISGFSDKAIEDNFKINDLKTVKIIEIIKSNPTIKNVYFTRGANQGLWKKLWQPIKKHCNENKINCIELLTPSGYAFYQFNKAERMKYDSLSSFITAKWKIKISESKKSSC